MKYILCDKPGKLSMHTGKQPRPKKGELLVNVKRIGICGTDLHAYGGNQAYFSYPRILGHELAAEIGNANASTKFKDGEKVAILPYLHCGKCVACRAGKTNCCTHLKVLGVHVDGGMQETIAVPEEILLPAPQLGFEEIAIIEPLAIAAHAIRRAKPGSGETVLVMGCGPIGLAIMAFAKLHGTKVLALDINSQRLDFAKKEMGVDGTILAGKDAMERIQEFTAGDLCQTVIDATGNKVALEAGVNYMSHGGKFVLVGLYKGDLSFHHPSIHAKETTIMCSRNATKKDFLQVMDVLSKGLFPTASYITHKVGFEEMIGNFDSWTKPETQVIKAMVTLSEV